MRMKSRTFARLFKKIMEERPNIPFRGLRDRHPRFNKFCFWFTDHWPNLVIWLLTAVVLVLFILLALVMCGCISVEKP